MTSLSKLQSAHRSVLYSQDGKSLADPQTPQYCAPLTYIGGSGGERFECDLLLRGGSLRSVSAWVSGPDVIQIHMAFSDGTSFTKGKASGDPDASCDLSEGETIKEMSLWGNGKGTRLGRIRFTTSKNQRFDSGGSTSTEYPVAVGSGICVGVVGRSGSDIDAFGFYFMKPYKSMMLDNVKYSGLDRQPCNPDRLNKETYSNNGKDPKDFDFSGSVAAEVSSSWTTGQNFSVGGSIGLTAGVPAIGEVSATFEWSVGQSSEQSYSESTTISLNWSFKGTLQPNDSIALVAVCYTGAADVTFNGTMYVILEDDEKFNYPVSGTYKGVSYTTVQVYDEHPSGELRRLSGGKHLTAI